MVLASCGQALIHAVFTASTSSEPINATLSIIEVAQGYQLKGISLTAKIFAGLSFPNLTAREEINVTKKKEEQMKRAAIELRSNFLKPKRIVSQKWSVVKIPPKFHSSTSPNDVWFTWTASTTHRERNHQPISPTKEAGTPRG